MIPATPKKPAAAGYTNARARRPDFHGRRHKGPMHKSIDFGSASSSVSSGWMYTGPDIEVNKHCHVCRHGVSGRGHCLRSHKVASQFQLKEWQLPLSLHITHVHFVMCTFRETVTGSEIIEHCQTLTCTAVVCFTISRGHCTLIAYTFQLTLNLKLSTFFDNKTAATILTPILTPMLS